MNARTMMVSLLLVAATGCGSVSGRVTTPRDEAEIARRLAGTTLYLVPATIENVTELSKGCDLSSEWYDRYRGEHQRFARMRAAYAESADVARNARSETARQRYLGASDAFRDSLSRLPHAPPSEPDSLVGRMSVRTTTMDTRGHYAFANTAPGQYFVVATGLGWTGAVVGHLPVRLDLRIGRLQAACAALGKTEAP